MSLFSKGIFRLKHMFGQVREELDEHLSAINENTNEIQANYAHIQDIDNKLNQLSSRLEHIELLLEGQPKRLEIAPLTYSEKQVFLALYTEEMPLTYIDLAKRTGYSEPMAQQYINSLIEKGVPLVKSYFNSTPFMKLNPEFKELQTKTNLLNLSLKSFVED